MTLTALSHNVPYTAETATLWQAHFKQRDEYMEKHLSGQDIAFMNHRGTNGAPSFPGDSAITVLNCLYGDPKNPAVDRTPAYYSPEATHHNQAAIQSMEFMLQQPYLDDKTKASLRDSIAGLRNSQQTQTQRMQEQMTKVLQSAKDLLAHRQVDGEARVIESIQVIDAVLRNIAGFQRPGMSEQAATFFDVYSMDIKSECELALGIARNPFPILKEFAKNETNPARFDQEWQRAMDAVRPEARAMAEKLKDLLGPYARLSPPAQGEPRGAGQEAAPSRRQDSRTMMQV
ncbi:hypothetical protein [Bordetella bronchialis]|uniref:Uncharacterized protein n=1 Tax=Bordetella bronchialis TaxID=463025 RepID=A0A193FF83_9BORD|nr:hypothetical protein [Bordetella bronchialis]ANN65928.1 hypothetical protein BAU06_06140 [Bordetella bronchialis]ANN71012.1 hypothetical protein BAU08_06400 [Bordetella bronchialis]